MKYPEEEAKNLPDIKYTVDEVKYRGELLRKLERSYQIHESPQDYFDLMPRSEWWRDNERRASQFLRPRVNKEDTIITTGVTRQKLMALLAIVNNLNLSSDITAFDKNNFQIGGLGQAMEAIIEKVKELDHDEEKKFLRDMELLKQGEVYVEAISVNRTELRKKLNKKFDGSLKNVKWDEKVAKLAPKIERNIIHPLNVFLGDITQYDIQNQTYLFTVRVLSYAKAETIYGTWDRFQYVSYDRKYFSPNLDRGIAEYNRGWTLSQIQNGQVEEIKFQNRWGNEYMIMLNGVMMLPIGFPLPWSFNLYNIEHQVLEPFSPFFYGGKSLPSRFKTLDSTADEFLRLMILKTQRSLIPPIANLTGKVLSARMFLPGKITNGVDPSQVKPMFENLDGINNTEYEAFQMIMKMVDSSSIDPSSQGMGSEKGTTATEVLTMQKNAEVATGNLIFAASMLEKKLDYLTIHNIIETYFDPTDTKIDEIRKSLINVYQTVSSEGNIPGKGRGNRIVSFTDQEIPKPEDINKAEEDIEDSTGVPTKIYLLNAPEIKKLHEVADLTWRITVIPKPKKSSEIDKLMLRNMIVDLSMFQQDLNMDYLEEKVALAWDEIPTKLFNSKAKGGTQQTGIQLPNAGGGGAPGAEGIAQTMGNLSATGGIKPPSMTGGQ
ncbi:hypothetical protein M0R04_10180 [Candidatus Dojkabacteria bacterium]|nr:hypothetical protein [Candidatus Dojkabacteria bacterium]